MEVRYTKQTWLGELSHAIDDCVLSKNSYSSFSLTDLLRVRGRRPAAGPLRPRLRFVFIAAAGPGQEAQVVVVVQDLIGCLQHLRRRVAGG